MMEGVDHRVAAAASGLGGQLANDARQQRTGHREKQDHDGTKDGEDQPSPKILSPCARRGV